MASCARLDPDYQKLNEILTRGNQAFAAKKYDEAIRIYDTGLAIRPDEPALLLNKGQAIESRGIDRYNASIRLSDVSQKEAGIVAAKQDFIVAVGIADQAVKATETNPIVALQASGSRPACLSAYAWAMQVLARHVNKERALEALEATHRAIEAETDRSKIEKLRVLAGKMLLDTGHPAEALDEFKLVLAGDPESIEGNLGVGLALSQSGDSSKFEEAIPYLRKFVDKAPDSHPMKADVQSTLDAAGPKR